MAEQSYFWDTNGTGDGATTYTEGQFAKLYRAIVGEGVIAGHLNGLSLTTAANSFTVQTGAASGDGFVYINDSAVTQSVPSATAGNTRIDRVVARVSWAAQTVRINRIAGTDSGTPTIPAIQTTSGTTWDIPLHYFTIDAAGAISNVVDQRLPAPGVAALVFQRQGGSLTNWNTAGSTNIATVGPTRRQVGAVSSGMATGGVSATVSVTFPTAFSAAPIMAAPSFLLGASSGPALVGNYTAISATGFTCSVNTHNGATFSGSATLLWTAEGPA